MKLIHCADIHLDSPLGQLPKEEADKRNREIFETFEMLVNYAVNNKVEGIIISGDLFDDNTLARKSYNNVINLIENNPNVNFYFIRGNHDGCVFYDNDINRLDNLYSITDNDKCIIKSTKCGNVVITGINSDKNGYKDKYNNICLNPNDFNILLMHGQINEYENSNEYNINLSRLRGKNIDYLALGHVHSYTEDKLDSRGVYVYPGCLEIRGFDELGKHGFVLLNIDEATFEFEHTFMDFSVRKSNIIDIDISDMTSSYMIEDVIDKELAKSGATANDFVLVTLTGRALFEVKKDIDYLKNTFKNNYFMFRIHDKSYRKNKSLDDCFEASTFENEFFKILDKLKGYSESDKEIMSDFYLKAYRGENIEL